MRKTALIAIALLVFLTAVRLEAVEPGPPAPTTTAALPNGIAYPLLTVPADTEASVELLSGIHTRVSHVDDMVAGRLLQPIYVGGQLALPPGSLLYGRITRVQAAGRLHRAGKLGFRFEQISLPDGQTTSINAALAALDHPGHLRVDREGYLEGSRGFGWKPMTAGFASAGGLVVVAAKGAAAATVLPAGVAALVGYELFAPKGDDVHLPPDTRCTVRLDSPVTVRGRS